MSQSVLSAGVRLHFDSFNQPAWTVPGARSHARRPSGSASGDGATNGGPSNPRTVFSQAYGSRGSSVGRSGRGHHRSISNVPLTQFGRQTLKRKGGLAQLLQQGGLDSLSVASVNLDELDFSSLLPIKPPQTGEAPVETKRSPTHK